MIEPAGRHGHRVNLDDSQRLNFRIFRPRFEALIDVGDCYFRLRTLSPVAVGERDVFLRRDFSRLDQFRRNGRLGALNQRENSRASDFRVAINQLSVAKPVEKINSVVAAEILLSLHALVDANRMVGDSQKQVFGNRVREPPDLRPDLAFREPDVRRQTFGTCHRVSVFLWRPGGVNNNQRAVILTVVQSACGDVL